MQETPRTPEEEEAERIAQAKEELLGRVSSAASKKLPDVPEWSFKRPEPPKQDGQQFRMSSRAFGMGMGVLYSLVVPAVGGLLIGMLADKQAGTGSKWTNIGFFIGIIAGFGMLIRLVAKMNEDPGH